MTSNRGGERQRRQATGRRAREAASDKKWDTDRDVQYVESRSGGCTLHAETGRNSCCERRETMCVVGEAELRKGGGGQHKSKEAENKSKAKTTYTLKKGDG